MHGSTGVADGPVLPDTVVVVAVAVRPGVPVDDVCAEYVTLTGGAELKPKLGKLSTAVFVVPRALNIVPSVLQTVEVGRMITEGTAGNDGTLLGCSISTFNAGGTPGIVGGKIDGPSANS